MPDCVVAESNSGLREIVNNLNGDGGEGGVEECKCRGRFMQAPSLRDDHYVDHVHLNREGYAVWDGVLWPIIEECFGVKELKERGKFGGGREGV